MAVKTLKIDDKDIAIEAGATIMDAAEKRGAHSQAVSPGGAEPGWLLPPVRGRSRGHE